MLMYLTLFDDNLFIAMSRCHLNLRLRSIERRLGSSTQLIRKRRKLPYPLALVPTLPPLYRRLTVRSIRRRMVRTVWCRSRNRQVLGSPIGSGSWLSVCGRWPPQKGRIQRADDLSRGKRPL